MRRTFLLGLMAAVAIVPAMAAAQDRGDWRGRRGGDSGASQPQRNNGGNGGGWRGRGDGGTATPTPTPAPAPAARGNGGNRFGGWAGRNGGNGGWSGRNGGNSGVVNPVANDQARAQAEARGRVDRNRWNGNGGGNRGWAGRNDGVNPSVNDQARAQAEARARADRARSNNDGWRNGRNNGWSGNNNRWGGDNRWRGNDGNRGGNWNRGWRGNDRYDWQRYRTSNRNIFRLPRYYAPYGWNYGYRRFSIGFMLDQVLFSRSYWIDDPYNYRLPEVDGEYRWVRYYNDALLVDIYSGEVVDVVYDIFY